MAEERNRIASIPVNVLGRNEILVLNEVCRSYGPIEVVSRLSLGIQRGECFGILGIKGCGKTTILNMITGTIRMTSGDAFVDGYSVAEEYDKVRTSYWDIFFSLSLNEINIRAKWMAKSPLVVAKVIRK